jgi:hypothetical protein
MAGLKLSKLSIAQERTVRTMFDARRQDRRNVLMDYGTIHSALGMVTNRSIYPTLRALTLDGWLVEAKPSGRPLYGLTEDAFAVLSASSTVSETTEEGK